METINIPTIITCLTKPHKQYIISDNIVININTKYNQILDIISELIDLDFDIIILPKYTTLECGNNILCNIILDVIVIDDDILVPQIYTNMDNSIFNIIVDTNSILDLLLLVKRNYLK